MRRSTLVRTLAVSCAAATAGVLSARALGQVGLPPITVSLPTVTLPAPTQPAPVPLPPPPPAPNLPPAPRPVPVPLPTTSAPTPTPTPAPTTTPSGISPATSPPPVGSPTPLGASSSVTRSSASRPTGPARVTRFRVTRARVRRTGERKAAAKITFNLTKPARVRFVVRGPAPSCDVVARFTVRGRAGSNVVRFTGRIGRRRLESGTYRIVARTGAKTSRPIAVVVGAGPVERPRCSQPIAAPEVTFEQLASTFDVGAPAPPSKRPDKDSGGVLPAIGRKIGELPEALPQPHLGAVSDSAGLPAWLIGLGLPLALLGAIAVVVHVFRYVRRLVYY
jgi:hypothetical protein